MFLEYVKLLSIGGQPEFSFDYIFPIALILLAVVTIVFIGYKIKEELVFLYMNDLLWVLF